MSSAFPVAPERCIDEHRTATIIRAPTEFFLARLAGTSASARFHIESQSPLISNFAPLSVHVVTGAIVVVDCAAAVVEVVTSELVSATGAAVVVSAVVGGRVAAVEVRFEVVDCAVGAALPVFGSGFLLVAAPIITSAAAGIRTRFRFHHGVVDFPPGGSGDVPTELAGSAFLGA